MKIQYYFDDVERDLLRSALRHLAYESNQSLCSSKQNAEGVCIQFTNRRISDLLKRLQEKDKP